MPSNSILQKAIRVGRESAPYQAATLTSGHTLASISEFDFKPDPLQIDQKNLAKRTFGPAKPAFDAGGSSFTVSLTVPVFAPSAPGSKPEISELLIAAGLAESVDTGVAVVYTPHTPPDPNTAPTVTVEVYDAGSKYRMVGSRGSFSLHASPKDGVTCKVELSSPWETPTPNTDAPATPSLPGAKLLFSGATAITEEGNEIDIGTFEFNLTAEIVKDTGSTGLTVYLVNHAPTLKINPFAVTTASDWQRLITSQTVAFHASFNNGAMVLDIPVAALTKTSAKDRAGRVSNEQEWSCLETNGDDQFTLTFK